MRNDGRCAALAEAKFGAGKFSPVFAMLTLGTGIGGALCIDGKVFEGCSYDSGDFGHHVIRSGHEAFGTILLSPYISIICIQLYHRTFIIEMNEFCLHQS